MSKYSKRELSLRTTLDNITMEDLLDRKIIQINMDQISGYLRNRVILVTGAGGSIGSELCRQIIKFEPKQLLLLGHGENSIYTTEKELKNLNEKIKIVSIIAEIQDKKRLEDIFSFYKPQIIFHAAAHKHVPLMELNPSEAIKNNVWGTKNVAECAQKYNAERFVFISSDKAVNSINIMGTSKRIAELVLQSMVKDKGTEFVVVRFGNVLGSRGSVVPLFKEQILKGGPITITHPEMFRYFMTIPEAVQLVIQAGLKAKGGKTFILDMGKPCKIVDLANKMIILAGLKPGKDIQIVYTGVRSGEKLVEEMISDHEKIRATYQEHIYICDPPTISNEFHEKLGRLENLVSQHDSVGAVKEILAGVKAIFPELYGSHPPDADSNQKG